MARYCRSHPNVVISSPCGVYDGLCDLCEGEADEARAEEYNREAALRDTVPAPPPVPADPIDDDCPF